MESEPRSGATGRQTRYPEFDDLSYSDYPLKKRFDGDRFAYIVPLVGSRARINVTTLRDHLGVKDFY